MKLSLTWQAVLLAAVLSLAACNPQPAPTVGVTPTAATRTSTPKPAAAVATATLAAGNCTVKATQAELRQGPLAEHELLATLDQGEIVKIGARDSSADWVEVRHDETSGWIEVSSLQCNVDVLAVAIEPNIPSLDPTIGATETQPPTPSATAVPTRSPTAVPTTPVTPTIAPPGEPKSAACTTLSKMDIRVVWFDNSWSETEFQVEQAVEGGLWRRIASIPGNIFGTGDRLQLRASGLEPSKTYHFRVIAYNAEDNLFSDYSNTVTCTTEGREQATEEPQPVPYPIR